MKPLYKKYNEFPSLGQVTAPVFLYHVNNTNSWYLSMPDISRELEHTVQKSYLEQKGRRNDSAIQVIPNYAWDLQHSTWRPCYVDFNVWCIHKDQLLNYISRINNRSRKTESEKLRLLARFYPKQVKWMQQAKPKIPIETNVVDRLSRISPWELRLSEKLGSYEIDVYIPRLRIAIEIDEHGHKNYDENEEKRRNTYLSDHNIELIRYSPDLNDPVRSCDELLRLLITKLISPAYKSFAKDNSLR